MMECVEDNVNSVVQCIPDCPNDMKPYVGKKFPGLDDAIKFYRDYAERCGFDVRMSTLRTHKDGTVLHRYVLCNREGKKDDCGPSQYRGKRSRMTVRNSCLARVVIKFNGSEGYIISGFNEAHTHNLVQEDHKHFLKSRRRFDIAHKSVALNCFRADLDASKSYSLFKELVRSQDKVGCSRVDSKNSARDLHASVSGVDAQIILDNLRWRRETTPGFVFDYEVDCERKLIRLFWCDNLAVQFFKAFGDVVSYDATYSTNEYNMIFTPFTGRDNHGGCVTFGAALLNHEDTLSYAWVLEKFKNAMGNQVPSLIITNHDPAVKIAVENVFPKPATRHRFCMWNTMIKLADKIPPSLRSDEGFLKKFHDIVCSNNIRPEEFEERWNNIMVEFNLVGNIWFTTMYEIRTYWIPAYFRDFSMGGLFLTTSLSESQNSFFPRYLNKNLNLIEFFMHYGSAIDSQRREHNHLSCLDGTRSPTLVTSHPIEKHASSVYTSSVFKKVQAEFLAGHNDCCIVRMSSEGSSSIYEVDDTVYGTVTVSVNNVDGYISCGCNYFIRKGLLCRHIFYVMKNRRMDQIPDVYVLRRWSKSACLEIDVGSTSNSQCDSIRLRLFAEFYKCVKAVEGNPELSAMLLADLRELTKKYSNIKTTSNKNLFQEFCGSSIPESVSSLSPSPVTTKGSDSSLKSTVEKTILMPNKPKRRCRLCNKMVNHDSRNCPEKDA